MSYLTRLLAVVFLLISPFFAFAQKDAPPNKATDIQYRKGELYVIYEGKIILSGKFKKDPENIKFLNVIDDKDGKLDQVLIFKREGNSGPLVFEGKIFGSEESFPCEADRDKKGLSIVRNSFGLSTSLLNRAVYDRKRDWVVSVDYYPNTIIKPLSSNEEENEFKVNITGNEIHLRFRPRYYQIHKGLKYFEPWTYKIWDKPVVGWCSWFAFWNNVTEGDIVRTAEVISNVLKPYGYEYLQIDDGYQSGTGLPELWLNSNEKFSSGLKNLADYIKSKGLKPGIWTNTAFKQQEYADKNKKYFVLDEKGKVPSEPWVGISVDGSVKEAVDTLVRPIYKGLRDMGWEYFKVDALRHLRYEGYNRHYRHFEKKNIDRVDAYRTYLKAIREEIGRDYFMMGCWGIRPELIGIIDGCRIGGDGYSFAGLSQYNSFNNVVWRNDPDHIELSPKEAYRSSMATSLTGSLFMLTDKPDVYKTKLVDPALRSAPVLFTMPGQIYEVEPSRIQALDQVDKQISGGGERPFDASLTPKCHLFLLELNRNYENWIVLGRTGGDFPELKFNELGLDQEKEYLVFEFWSKKYMGTFSQKFVPGNINPDFNCQLFCIRERLQHPQLIATNRHVSCGGFDIDNLKWEDNSISGSSKLVGNDDYIIYLTEPEGYEFNQLLSSGEVVNNVKNGLVREITLRADKNRQVDWLIKYIQ
ncbi:hypothetical protein ACFLRR_00540 [Bacteroidota bacterium]